MRTGRKYLQPAQKVIDLIKSLIDWIYPPQCRVCGKEPDICPFLCNTCYQKLKVFDKTPDSIAYHKDDPAKEVKALFLFNEVLQKMIHEIKYMDASYVAEFFGKKLGEYYKLSSIAKVDAIVPVPLHAVRKRERTYNQSECLARGISKQWEIPLLNNFIKRKRSTGTQTKLNKDERQENMKDAFQVRNIKTIPESVCVVDDVFTTGATTMEIARTLKKVGVKKVNILCLATPIRKKRRGGEEEKGGVP